MHNQINNDLNNYFDSRSCSVHNNLPIATIKRKCIQCQIEVGDTYYKLWTSNCSQVTMEYILQGVLPGTDLSGKKITVGEYIGHYGFGISPLPDINMNNMQSLFGNSGTSSIAFEEAVKKGRFGWINMGGEGCESSR